MTQLPPAGAPDVLYIFDLHCWMHRFFRTIGGRAAHGFVSDFVGGILRNQRPAYVAVCTDLPWPTFRHEMAPKVYKAQREPPDPVLLERMRWAREMLEDVHGIKVFSMRGYEADDLIAALVKRATESGLRSVILAKDKDLLQLVDGERVFMWDGKREVWGVPEVRAKFGIRPDQLRDYLAIVGDAVDNVPGIKGFGPKAAVEILQEFDTLERAMGGAMMICPRPELYKKRPKYATEIESQWEQALLSQRLVTLAADAPIEYQQEELRYE